MGDTSSICVELEAPAAEAPPVVEAPPAAKAPPVFEAAADAVWLRQAGFVEISIPPDDSSEAPAHGACSAAAAPSTSQRPTHRALALGAFAGAIVCGPASAGWVAPLIPTDSWVLAASFITTLAGALTGGWIGSRAVRACARPHAG
jgi:hypothetical protein